MDTLYQRIGGREGLQRLLRHFYADIRQHAVLGPIFNTRIGDWAAHLEKVGEFWARQTGGPSAYPGGMAAAHLPLPINSEHVAHWLDLWDFNCQRNLPRAEAHELSDRARGIGQQLQRIMQGQGGLRVGM